jgi:hypothetical protein
MVLSAGIILNLVLAFVLFFASNWGFTQRTLTNQMVITETSVAAQAGIENGEVLVFASLNNGSIPVTTEQGVNSYQLYINNFETYEDTLSTLLNIGKVVEGTFIAYSVDSLSDFVEFQLPVRVYQDATTFVERQVTIRLDAITTNDGFSLEPLGIGFYYGVEKGRIYTAFLSTPNLPEDQLLYTAQGYLQYNKPTNEYQISSKQQLKQRNEGLSSQVWTTENYLSLSLEDNSCNMFGEGEIDFKLDIGDVNIQSFGTIEYDAVNNKKTTLNISSRFSFPIDQNVMEGIAKKAVVNETLKSTKPSEISNTNLYRALKHWSSEKEYQKMKEEIVDESLKKIPKDVVKTLILFSLLVIKSISQPLDFPIQFCCINFTLSGQPFKLFKDSKSLSEYFVIFKNH